MNAYFVVASDDGPVLLVLAKSEEAARKFGPIVMPVDAVIAKKLAAGGHKVGEDAVKIGCVTVTQFPPTPALGST